MDKDFEEYISSDISTYDKSYLEGTYSNVSFKTAFTFIDILQNKSTFLTSKAAWLNKLQYRSFFLSLV